MPEEIAAAPVETPTPTLRPEAMSALDALGAKLFSRDTGEVETASGSPAEPIRPAIPAPTETPPARPAPAAAAPAPAPVAEPDILTPPDALLSPGEVPAGAPPADPDAVPSVDEVFPKEKASERADLRNWREAYRAAEAKIKTLTDRVKTAPQPDEVAQARISELEGRLGEFSQKFERIALMEHPAFVKQFEQPLAQLRQSATQLIKDAGLEGDGLDRVLGLTGNERIKAMDQLAETIESPTLRRRLERTVEEIEAKEGERARVLSDVKGNAERLSTAEKIQHHQAMEQEARALQQTTDGVLTWFANEQKIPFFQKAEGNEKWNDAMAEDETQTKDLVTNCKDQSQLVAAVALGVKFPRVYSAYQAERKARMAAEKALSDRRGAEPSLSRGPDGNGRNDGNGNAEDANPADADMSPEGIRRRFNARVRT